MLSTPLCRFAAPHTISRLPDLPNTRNNIIKARLFLSLCIAVHIEFIWRSQRQSEKVNIRNACFLPVRAKCGRFCVLMNGRVFGHRKLSVFRTAATVQTPYWQNGGSYPPDLTATDRLLVPANAKAGSAAWRPTKSSISRRGDHRTRVAPSLQPSLAVCVRRRP